MTQTSELVAGREMDALVAEKVMGYPGAAIGGWNNKLITPRPYSTDIAAAWQVVEKFQYATIQRMTDGSHLLDDWYCLLRRDGHSDNRHGGESYGPTAPEAICRAALAAIGA